MNSFDPSLRLLLRNPRETLRALDVLDGEESLLAFTRRLWPVLEPHTPFVDGWALGAICEHLEAVTDGEITRLLMNVPPGFMKALESTTPVFTTWGWKEHGDLRPGDFVYGPDGRPKKVLGATEKRTELTYRVEFDDGTSINAGAGHLWEVERDFPYGDKGRRLRKKVTVTTPELIQSIKGRALQRPDRIAVAAPIEYAPRRLLIDPYLLGAWLGDGATNSGCIYAAEQDVRHFEKLGRIASTVRTEGKQDFHRIAVEGLQIKLRILGLLGNKHIPDDYLESSVDQRLELLRGLMDTDGTATKTGNCSFTTKHPHLGEAVATLCASLGIKPHLSETYSTINKQRFGPYYVVGFTVPIGLRVFHLERKQARVKFAETKRSRYRYVTAVIPIGDRVVNCISVEGQIYLAGKRFVPTHNSLMTNVFWPAWEWGPQRLAHHRFVTFSYAAQLTERDNRRFLDLLKSPEYQWLWGDRFELRKAGETLVSNDKTGWKLASSVGGVGTGERGDRILLDDPHNVKESESDVVRSETVRWFREAMSNRLNDMEKSAIVVIMQRVHEADVSGAIIESAADYTHLMIPMEYDGRRYTTSIGWTDPREDDGALAWPERFPASVIADIKAIGGPYAYAGQYQQAPSPRGGGIFRREWWQLWGNEADPTDVRNRTFPACEYIVASLDPAYTEKQENDYSAVTVWGVFRDERQGDMPKIMLLHAWRDRLAIHDLVEKCAEICKRFKADRLLIESKASGISVAQELRRLYAGELFGVQLVDPKKLDKVARAYAVQPLFADEMIYAPFRKYSHGSWGDREWCDMLISEMASFPRAPHDDLTDSATQALSHLRRIGLAVHETEIKRDELDQMMFKPEPKPLYGMI